MGERYWSNIYLVNGRDLDPFRHDIRRQFANTLGVGSWLWMVFVGNLTVPRPVASGCAEPTEFWRCLIIIKFSPITVIKRWATYPSAIACPLRRVDLYTVLLTWAYRVSGGHLRPFITILLHDVILRHFADFPRLFFTRRFSKQCLEFSHRITLITSHMLIHHLRRRLMHVRRGDCHSTPLNHIWRSLDDRLQRFWHFVRLFWFLMLTLFVFLWNVLIFQ